MNPIAFGSDVHKWELAIASTRKQTGCNDEAGALVTKREVEEACKGEKNLQQLHILKILGEACDGQNVPVVQELLLDEDLKRCLTELGHVCTAESLRVFGEVHKAMNMPGFGTAADRNKFLEELRRILLKAYGAAYHPVAGLTPNRRIGGLPRFLVNALLCNIDARIHLLERHPALSNCLVEYMLDTDDIEFNFSALAKRATWNAPAEQQLRLLHLNRRLARLRRYKNSGVSLQHSKHRKYALSARRSLEGEQSGTRVTYV